ncbi:cell division FtsZ family protein [Puniceicoccaceae bacterium K14]|nr:cell division FtsZ family protein [Puniceicoccaceae bacterium K14]
MEEQPKEIESIRIKVIGIGGAGTNMADRLMFDCPKEVSLTVMNTDQQALSGSPISDKFCVGKSVTYGLGTGGDLEVGREAARVDKARLETMVEGVDLLFLTVGLGGGTGTSIAPILADMANKNGTVVIAFAAMPFTIERAERASVAKHGLEALRDKCNAVIPLPNDLLIQETDPDASILDAFAKADAWIERAIKSIWSMMHRPGLINLDFSQLKLTFSRKAGKTLFGLGAGEGEDSAKLAVEDLKLCPLLHTPEFSKKADHLLVNIVGGAHLSISQVQHIMDSVTDEFGKDSNVVMGAVIDEQMGDKVEICVVGTSDVSGVSLMRGSQYKRAVSAVTSESHERTLKVTATSQKRNSRGSKSRKKPNSTEQHEFSFSDEDPKGEFENVSSTVIDGQDLDTPTYLRKGVKIVL